MMLRKQLYTRSVVTVIAITMLVVALACGGEEVATPTTPPTATTRPTATVAAPTATTVAPTATSSVPTATLLPGEPTATATVAATSTPVPEAAVDFRSDWVNYLLKHPGYQPTWGTPQYGGILKLTGPSAPTSFSATSTGNFGAFIDGKGFHQNTLLRYDPWLEHSAGVVCDLCESYEVSADGKKISFKLRQGIKFQSEGWGKDKGAPGFGAELVCKDVKYSMEWYRDPHKSATASIKAAGKRLWGHLEEVTCPDGPLGYTGVLSFSKFRNDTLGNLAFGYAIWNKEYHEWLDAEYPGVGDTAKEEAYLSIMGTGAFIPVSANVDTVLVSRKNPNYWIKGAPFVDGIEFYPILDYNTKFAAWVTGKVHHLGHGSSGMTKAQVAQVQKSYPDFTLHVVNYNHISQLPLNPLRPPFDNWKVRWAINLALDRQDWNNWNIIGNIHMSTPMYFLHPVSPWGLPYEKFKNEPGYRADKKDEDIREANRLLDEVFGKGIRPVGTKISIWTLLSRREIGVWAVDQFREKLGWELDAKFVDRGEYTQNFDQRTYVIQPNAAPTHGMSNQSDPGIAFLAIISDTSVATNYYFYQGWKGQGEGKDWEAEKARIDALTWELVYTLDQQRRQELTTYLERYYVEERTTVPMLGSMNVAWGTRPEMKGSYFAGIGTGGNWPLRDRWWLTKK